MSEETNEAYKEGVRDGRIQSLEHRMNKSDSRHEAHENRFKYIERLMWMFIGAVGLVQFFPMIERLFK